MKSIEKDVGVFINVERILDSMDALPPKIDEFFSKNNRREMK